MPYQFERQHQYKVVVYDVTDHEHVDDLKNHNLIGEAKFTIHEIVTAESQTLQKFLEFPKRPAKKSGEVQVSIEKRHDSKEEVSFKLSGSFESSEGYNFFLILKHMGPSSYKPVYRSELAHSNESTVFTWDNVSILTSELAIEESRVIRFEFFKSSSTGGKHTNLGYTSCFIADLRQGKLEFSLTGGSRSGNDQKVRFSEVNFEKRHSFLDYIFGGCEIQLSVAIDFTLSNGHYSNKDSLHHLDMKTNEYLSALKSVGKILQYYDSDKKIPCFGFGAAVPPSTIEASHCFALNGNIFDPEVDGLDGVIEAYKNTLSNVNLYGPTRFAPIIEYANDMAEDSQVSQENQRYNILLMITDGIINDME